MPPPGVAPSDAPQPGTPGGGGLPYTDPYAASLAPKGTVPIAVLPPFNKYKEYPTKCVIFSQLTDFERDSTDDEDDENEVPKFALNCNVLNVCFLFNICLLKNLQVLNEF